MWCCPKYLKKYRHNWGAGCMTCSPVILLGEHLLSLLPPVPASMRFTDENFHLGSQALENQNLDWLWGLDRATAASIRMTKGTVVWTANYYTNWPKFYLVCILQCHLRRKYQNNPSTNVFNNLMGGQLPLAGMGQTPPNSPDKYSLVALWHYCVLRTC